VHQNFENLLPIHIRAYTYICAYKKRREEDKRRKEKKGREMLGAGYISTEAKPVYQYIELFGYT
jgi:hypothetical protein